METPTTANLFFKKMSNNLDKLISALLTAVSDDGNGSSRPSSEVSQKPITRDHWSDEETQQFLNLMKSGKVLPGKWVVASKELQKLGIKKSRTQVKAKWVNMLIRPKEKGRGNKIDAKKKLFKQQALMIRDSTLATTVESTQDINDIQRNENDLKEIEILGALRQAEHESSQNDWEKIEEMELENRKRKASQTYLNNDPYFTNGLKRDRITLNSLSK
jgi:hypothetical protein